MSFFTRPFRSTFARSTFLSLGMTLFRSRSFSSTQSLMDQSIIPTSEEPLQYYTRGGYHPTNLGDRFKDRYLIVRKLGWGVYSTVWLAEDLVCKRHVALKILTDEATQSDKLHELDFLQCIKDRDPQHPGHAHVIQLIDHFVHHGPHGSHLCLATEVLGPSIVTLGHSYHQQRLPLPIVKRIVRQVLQGVAYLHVCNIIHTDLKTDNFLTVIDDVEAVVKSELRNSSPKTYPTVSLDDGPLITYVESQPLPLTKDISSLNVKIADLGVSCWADRVGEHFTDLIQSQPLRAPEVVIGAGWDKSCDIWSIGCLVYEMVMGKWLFPAKLQPASQAALMILMFGNFPLDLVSRAKYHDLFFKQDGSFLTQVDLKSLEFIVRIKKSGLPPDEESRFVEFLRCMLVLHPNERPGAIKILEHEWLQSSLAN